MYVYTFVNSHYLKTSFGFLIFFLMLSHTLKIYPVLVSLEQIYLFYVLISDPDELL